MRSLNVCRGVVGWPWSRTIFTGSLLWSCFPWATHFNFCGPPNELTLLYWIFSLEYCNHCNLSTVCIQNWCYAVWNWTHHAITRLLIQCQLVVYSILGLVRKILAICHRLLWQRSICLVKKMNHFVNNVWQVIFSSCLMRCDSGMIPAGKFQVPVQL